MKALLLQFKKNFLEKHNFTNRCITDIYKISKIPKKNIRLSSCQQNFPRILFSSCHYCIIQASRQHFLD